MKSSDIDPAEVIRACALFHAGDSRWPADILRERYPRCPEKVVYAKMDRMARRGLIDYGTSLRSAWPTEAGWKLVDPDGSPGAIFLRSDNLTRRQIIEAIFGVEEPTP